MGSQDKYSLANGNLIFEKKVQSSENFGSWGLSYALIFED